MLLVGRDDEVVAVDVADDAEALEAHERRAQVLDAGALDAELGAGDRGEADERADLDVVGADAMRRAAERRGRRGS